MNTGEGRWHGGATGHSGAQTLVGSTSFVRHGGLRGRAYIYIWGILHGGSLFYAQARTRQTLILRQGGHGLVYVCVYMCGWGGAGARAETSGKQVRGRWVRGGAGGGEGEDVAAAWPTA